MLLSNCSCTSLFLIGLGFFIESRLSSLLHELLVLLLGGGMIARRVWCLRFGLELVRIVSVEEDLDVFVLDRRR